VGGRRYGRVEYGSKPLKSAWRQSWDHATSGAAAMCAGQLCLLRRRYLCGLLLRRGQASAVQWGGAAEALL